MDFFGAVGGNVIFVSIGGDASLAGADVFGRGCLAGVAAVGQLGAWCWWVGGCWARLRNVRKVIGGVAEALLNAGFEFEDEVEFLCGQAALVDQVEDSLADVV